MAQKELMLFNTEELTLKKKFYLFIDLLISNQSNSQLESILFIGIYYLQIISGFFSYQLKVFDKVNSTSDKILNYIEQILRLKDLLNGHFSTAETFIILIFIIIIFFFALFVILVNKMNHNSFYEASDMLMNYFIKIFIYILFNMILDLVFSTICFAKGHISTNPFYPHEQCSLKDKIPLFIIEIILLIISIFFDFFVQFFYCDSLYLSKSYYSRISCNYEIYLSLNSIIYSLLLTYSTYLSPELFLIYNIIISIVLLKFFLNSYLFYNSVINMLTGFFHILYFWTSLFSLLMKFISFNEKGIVYILSSFLILYFYSNIKSKVEENILLNTPFYKITNKKYVLYYIKNLIDKMNNLENNPKEKIILTGIMEIHSIECPNPECISKTNKKIYLPHTNEWSDRSKPYINDKIYLLSFILVVMNYFINQNLCSPEMIINVSLYYLVIIGNYCKAIYFYKRVKQMKLKFQESFALARLELAITKALNEKLKQPNEICNKLEELNISMYFKYEELSKKLLDEMGNDVSLLLIFWGNFKNTQVDPYKVIDFNKIFNLTNKIRITKRKVEKMWKNLINIYNGVNDFFELYIQYVDQINDDDHMQRELENAKRKNETSVEHFHQNLYASLFTKETGILIVNGDKGQEGVIERANNDIELIFKYKPEEIRGTNVSEIMPKLIGKEHTNFIIRFFEVGEKKIIDKEGRYSFGKDKDNAVIKLRLLVKLFPVLNESVYFISMINKENIDDMIILDREFNIQGMSLKLRKILHIENKMLFQDNDIPFYVICKKFVNFYRIFLDSRRKRKDNKGKQSINLIIEESGSYNSNIIQTKVENENQPDEAIRENIEINENIELEYEILLPQFIVEYSNSSMKSNDKYKVNNNKEIKEEDEGKSDDIQEENELLIEESPKDTTPKENIFNRSEGITKLDNKPSMRSLNTNAESVKQSSEEKIFKQKLKQYITLFNEGKFNELEDLIDKNTKDTKEKEYKFNFTFDRVKYGDNHNVIYIVRCIDHKNDIATSDEGTLGELNNVNNLKCRKEKYAGIKTLIEVFADEKRELLLQQENFINMTLINKEFQQILRREHEEIVKLSKVHGQKKEDFIDDENSSQSSQPGYNSDLCQKNRIEEIRANILKNVSHFYTLKYIKIGMLFFVIFTLSFCSIYIYFFTILYKDLKTISKLNLDLFQTTQWTSNLISTLISLRTLFVMRTDSKYKSYIYKSYIDNETAYFSEMKDYAKRWYENMVQCFGIMEKQIGQYVNNNDIVFWNNHKVSYDNLTIDDNETFPLATFQVLNAVNSLLKNKNFNLLATPTSSSLFLNYVGFLSIENAYDNLIPMQFERLQTIPQIFQQYNSYQIYFIIILIITYISLFISLAIVYCVLFYITNKNMGEGLEKVTKIKLEKIEETIKKIEGFQMYLKKFRDAVMNNVQYIYDEGDHTSDIGGKEEQQDIKNTKTPNNIDTNAINPKLTNNINPLYNGEPKKHMTLNIFYYNYCQLAYLICVAGGFIIPIYLITYSMVSNTNTLIDIQKYFFWKILVSSSSALKVKCMMSNCNITTVLNFTNEDTEKSEMNGIIQGIAIFDNLDDYYNNNFLLNACKAAFIHDKQRGKFDLCLNDPLIKSANNTDSLLNLMLELVDDIEKDEEMKRGKVIVLQDGNKSLFDNFMLFNSTSFKELETIFYKYIIDVSDNISFIVEQSLNRYVVNKKNIILVLIIIYAVLIIAFCVYIGFFFVDKLIHLLSISRCILKIIPTSVINSTQELESWIENKY